MTDEELAQELYECWVKSPSGFRAVAARARELLAAAALPAEPPAGFVRVRGRVWLDRDGGWQVGGGRHWTPADWVPFRSPFPTVAIITADVDLRPKVAEIVGRVEE